MGGFLLAFALRDSYGGSMMHEDGRELRFLGMNIAVFGFGLALLCNVAALRADHRARPLSKS